MPILDFQINELNGGTETTTFTGDEVVEGLVTTGTPLSIFFKLSTLRAYIEGALTSNIPRLNIASLFTKAQAVAVVTLIDGSTVSVDASTSNVFRLVAGTSAFTLANPSSLLNGQTIVIRIIQDSTGGRIISYGSKYKFAAGADKILSTAGNTADLLTCTYDSADDTLFCTLLKGFS